MAGSGQRSKMMTMTWRQKPEELEIWWMLSVVAAQILLMGAILT